MGPHCTLGGKCVLLEDSAIRLSLMPWLLSLVLPLMMVVKKSGRATGLVVLMNPFLLGCACTSHLDWVAQYTAFNDFDTFSVLFSFVKSTAISVIVLPIATGTLFLYSVVGKTSRRASISKVWVPTGRDNLASIYPTYSMLSPHPLNIY